MIYLALNSSLSGELNYKTILYIIKVTDSLLLIYLIFKKLNIVIKSTLSVKIVVNAQKKVNIKKIAKYIITTK